MESTLGKNEICVFFVSGKNALIGFGENKSGEVVRATEDAG